MTSDSVSPPNWVTDWLSPARLAPYVQAAGAERALELYAWNCTVSMAMFELLGWFEIGWRNLVDQAICRRRASGLPHWLFDPTFPLHSTTWDKVDRTVELVRRGGVANPTPGQVITELPLGFWRFTSKGYRITLWRPYLSSAFPHAPRRPDPAGIDHRLQEIIRVRNRIAHHEPVFNRVGELRQRVTDILLVGSFFNPHATSWWRDNNSVLRVLDERP